MGWVVRNASTRSCVQRRSRAVISFFIFKIRAISPPLSDSTSLRTSSVSEGSVREPTGVARLLTLSGVHVPPVQCTVNTSCPPSRRATSSRIAARNSCLRNGVGVSGWFHTRQKSRDNLRSCSRCSSLKGGSTARSQLEFLLRHSDLRQPFVESLLEIVNHEPVFRICKVELLQGPISGVLRRLESKSRLLNTLLALVLLNGVTRARPPRPPVAQRLGKAARQPHHPRICRRMISSDW